MSILLAFDGGEPTDLASNSGWGRVQSWSATLVPADYPQLVHLIDHGWSQQLPALALDVAGALVGKPPPDVRSVLENLSSLLKGSSAEVVVVTDGLAPG